MGKIKQLDNELSNLIAAGEVVVNMASVVKELVENSIDAMSTSIKVELLDAGLNEIKVIDDGEGMSLEDMKMCLKRHATSKIKTQHDLFHINSLGFRGEAIPSIASVSHLEITSSEGNEGHRLFFKNGQLIEEEPFAPKRGTVMTVRYLFYNTPARLKHLKSENTELAYIVDYMNKISLSHPEISFSLSNNNKRLFHTNGNNDLLQVLSNIYNIEIIKNMISFENRNQYFSISGYFAKPIYNRSQRNHITVIANDRMIKNTEIIKSVSEAYKTYLPVGKYPIVLLVIKVDPLLIDVNVHPQKLEVKFTEQRLLTSLITQTLKNQLMKLTLIPEMKETVSSTVYQKSFDLREEVAEKDSTTHFKQETDYSKILSDNVPLHVVKESSHETIETKNTTLPEKHVETVRQEAEENQFKIPMLQYIGQYMGTYLIAQNEEGLFIIDQHAAAERIRYEKYKKMFGRVENNSVKLLIPFKLHLSNTEALQLKNYEDELTHVGILFSINDEYGIDILEVPSWFPKGFELSYTEEIMKYLLNEETITTEKIRDSLAKNLSCKHSIKANKYINHNEISVLLKDLSRCDNPFTCPHGRPVLIKWTQTDIEKMFKRIM
jgi:DNA mismatch repair protein MutL